MHLLPKGAISTAKRLAGNKEVTGIATAFELVFSIFSDYDRQVQRLFSEELQAALLEYQDSLDRLVIRGNKGSFQLDTVLETEEAYLAFIETGKLLVDSCIHSL